jgi:hypothetical protein
MLSAYSSKKNIGLSIKKLKIVLKIYCGVELVVDVERIFFEEEHWFEYKKVK